MESPQALPLPRRTSTGSWENYLDRLVVWIDADPTPIPTPGAIVQWFSFVTPPPPSQDALQRRSLSPFVDASPPSHVSNSVDTRSFDSPPLVPSSVPEGDVYEAGEGTEGGSFESGRATKPEVSAVWRFSDGSWHPRNNYLQRL
jgi:hypothetical protein